MLKTWITGTKDFTDQGLSLSEWINDNVTIVDGGKLGKCMSFNGSTSRLSTTGYELGNKWSFSCWVKDDSSVTAWQTVLGLNNNGSDSDLQMGLWLKSNESRLEFSYNGAYNSVIPYTPNQWNHFVGTYDGSSAKFYINGELKSTNANSGNLSRPNLTIGGRCSNINGGHASFANPFKGLINDVKIWDDYVLSQKEISELKKMLILHYPLDGNNGTLANPNLLSNEPSNWGKYTCNSSTYASSGSRFAPYQITVPIEPSTTYTVSVTDNLKLGYDFYVGVHQSDSNLTHLNDSGWKLLPYTFTSRADAANVRLCFRDSLNNGTNLQSYVNAINKELFIKFEKNDKATPWCPNPSDALYTALGYDDGIEYDTSGYGNNGTKVGALSYSIDSPRYLASTMFDGTQRIQSDPLPPEAQTVSLWMKTTKDKNTAQCIFGDSASALCMFIYSGGLVTYFRGSKGSTGSRVVFGDEYIENGWNHLVVVKTSNTTRDVYCNGIKLTPGNNDYYTPAEGFWVGARNANNQLPFYGQIADIRVYTTQLTDSDIQKLYTVSASIDSNGNAYSAAYVEG